MQAGGRGFDSRQLHGTTPTSAFAENRWSVAAEILHGCSQLGDTGTALLDVSIEEPGLDVDQQSFGAEQLRSGHPQRIRPTPHRTIVARATDGAVRSGSPRFRDGVRKAPPTQTEPSRRL